MLWTRREAIVSWRSFFKRVSSKASKKRTNSSNEKIWAPKMRLANVIWIICRVTCVQGDVVHEPMLSETLSSNSWSLPCVFSFTFRSTCNGIERSSSSHHTIILVYIFIIWQAPRAGSMQRILCSDWLPERARWSDTARPGLPRFVPANKISPKFKRVHESFLLAEITFC